MLHMETPARTKLTVVDPVCHMVIDPESAAGSLEHEGQTYYFCHQHCLHKFSENPQQYLQPAPLAIQPISITRRKDKSIYTCPMHPEVQNEGPGSCPKCGMALEPLTVALPQKKVEYTCPMHPEVVRDAPGTCPICGMALEPKTASLGDAPNHELLDMRRRFIVGAIL